MVKGRYLLSVIVPVCNEEKVLFSFFDRLSIVLNQLYVDSEIIFINDGSKDHSLQIIKQLTDLDQRVSLVDLSRNFGKEIAMAAGLDYAQGDAVIIIDADLQDPPELIPKLLKEWENGFDNVYAQRIERKGDSFLRKSIIYFYYRFLQRLSDVPIPEDTGDYRLLSRRAVEALKELKETQRFSKGLFAWIGFSHKAVVFEREARYAGYSKWTFLKLLNLAMDGITSFSTAPLRLATILGGVCAGLAFMFMSFVIMKTLIFGEPVQGYPSLMVVVLFIGGMQLLCLGIMGEYLGRIFNETKKRPLYFINTYIPRKNSRQKALEEQKTTHERYTS